MIVRRASAALLLRDGYTARPLASGAAVFAWLDGRPLRPLWKTGGYLVLTDLPPGKHLLRLRHRCFQEEALELETREDLCREMEIDLIPGPGYPFRSEPLRLTLTVSSGASPLAGEPVWAGWQGAVQLKFAREGKDEPRLFCKGDPGRLPIPGWFLAGDPKNPELVHLRALRGERGILENPLSAAHNRGTPLLAARRYTTGPEGSVRAVFREPGSVGLLCRGTYKEVELRPEQQTVIWKLEGEEKNG